MSNQIKMQIQQVYTSFVGFAVETVNRMTEINVLYLNWQIHGNSI